jgi:hypothetical protein
MVVVARCICAAEQPRCSAWELVNPRPQANHLRDVAYGGGLWVAVGEGTVVISTDAATWAAVPLPGRSLRGVTYGNHVFVAVGSAGAIIRSTSGASWESIEPPVSAALTAVAFVGGQFLAVGDAGTVVTSSDGVAWTSEHPPELQGDLLGVRESGSFAGNAGPMFLVWGPSSIALRRLDGTWMGMTLPTEVVVSETAFWAKSTVFATLDCTDCGWCGIANSCLYETHDGATWYPTNVSLLRGPYEVLATGGGFIGLVWNQYAEVSSLCASSDGLSWSHRSTHFDVRVRALAVGRGMYVGVGDYGAIWTSPNSRTWSSISGPTSYLDRVVSNGRSFAANGAGGAPGPPGFTTWDGSMLASGDGRNWTPIMATGITVVAARPGLFLGVHGKEVFSSADGQEWVAQEPLPTYGAPAALWDGRHFVILSWAWGPCMLSPCNPVPAFAAESDDLSTWSTVEQPELFGRLGPTIGAAFNGQRYIAPATSNARVSGPPFSRLPVYVSDNGLSWRTIEDMMPYFPDGTSAIASDGHGFVAVRGETVVTSADGLDWSSADIAPLHLVGAMWTGDEYVAVGDDGAGHAAIARSPDGSTWTSEAFPAIPARLLAVAGGRRVQLAVGTAGLTLRRECHPQTPSRRLRGPR